MRFISLFKKKVLPLERLESIIQEVILFINSDATSMIYTSFDHPFEYVNYLEQLLIKVKSGDIEALNKLKLEFAPTGNLQELSISNGWGKEFLKIAKEFDDVIEDLNL